MKLQILQVGPFLLGVMVGPLSMPATAQVAATAPQTTAVEATTATEAAAWKRNAALDVKVALEAERMPLRQVLAALSKQSGLKLDGGELAATKKVTMAVRDMSLRDAMSAIEELYQAAWQPNGEGGFLLKPVVRPQWQNQLTRLGNLHAWGYYRTHWKLPFAPPYLTAQYAYDWPALVNNLGPDALMSPQGVPFSELPPDAQNDIRRVSRWDITHQVITSLAKRLEAERDLTLSIRAPEMAVLPPRNRNRRSRQAPAPFTAYLMSGDHALAAIPLAAIPLAAIPLAAIPLAASPFALLPTEEANPPVEAQIEGAASEEEAAQEPADEVREER